jgi:hypothetical protein
MRRSRTWIGVAVLSLMAGLIPAQAASPGLSEITLAGGAGRHACGHITLDVWGSCSGGGSCCDGFPESRCYLAL